MSSSFKYETHAHTAEGSACSRFPARELVRYYKELGYSGLFVTDHFLNGNTAVPKGLPFKTRIELFMTGYEEACREGDKIGLPVFFGYEYSHTGTDFLIYGIDKQWLLESEEITALRFSEYAKYIHDAGGILVQAHPFREASYVPMIRLAPRDIDGVEMINASNTSDENRRAAWYAQEYDLPVSAGSDCHFPLQMHAGVESTTSFSSERDLMRLITERKAKVFTMENPL